MATFIYESCRDLSFYCFCKAVLEIRLENTNQHYFFVNNYKYRNIRGSCHHVKWWLYILKHNKLRICSNRNLWPNGGVGCFAFYVLLKAYNEHLKREITSQMFCPDVSHPKLPAWRRILLSEQRSSFALTNTHILITVSACSRLSAAWMVHFASGARPGTRRSLLGWHGDHGRRQRLSRVDYACSPWKEPGHRRSCPDPSWSSQLGYLPCLLR